jgi:hypothetical protein
VSLEFKAIKNEHLSIKSIWYRTYVPYGPFGDPDAVILTFELNCHRRYIWRE